MGAGGCGVQRPVPRQLRHDPAASLPPAVPVPLQEAQATRVSNLGSR